MQRIISEEHNLLIQQERSLLEELRVQLTRLDADEDDLNLLKSSLAQLDELFLLVVVGEFNAGKTAFLNAMLGQRLLTEGVTPTTDNIHLLRYGPEIRKETIDEDILVLEMPVEWLTEINLVDTPGTNAVIKRHQKITEHFVPRSDLVLFVTSADRPFSESERTFLEQIRQWGKKILIVVNKFDLISGEEDRRQILEFVGDNATQLLGTEPEIFPVSARQALEAKTTGKEKADTLWQESQFEKLETFMLETLDTKERIRLKLENPIGISQRLIEKYSEVIQNRREVLTDDFKTLDTIDEQLEAYQMDMRRDFKYQLSHVDNLLFEMAERGDQYADTNLRITNVFSLLNSDALRASFERDVVGELSRDADQQINELIDWMIDKDYRQWRDIMEYLNRRSVIHADRIVGTVQGDFEFNRQAMLNQIGRSAREVVDSYDKEAESLKLAEQVQRSLVQTAAVGAGAIGLGSALVAILSATWMDVTGVVGASAVAALGLYILPARKDRFKKELREQINALRDNLHDVMTRQFENEMGESILRVREAIAPYTRFVRVERDKLENLDAAFKETQTTLRNIRIQVQNVQ
ncbi:MAG: dynamin family protein [Chloroflexota bacterium]